MQFLFLEMHGRFLISQDFRKAFKAKISFKSNIL